MSTDALISYNILEMRCSQTQMEYIFRVEVVGNETDDLDWHPEEAICVERCHGAEPNTL